MSRIRTIKPAFFLDEDLASLNPTTRLFFIGLWTQADREGRLEDRPKMLKALLSPNEDVNAEEILTALSPKFITRYESAAGRRYIAIVNFLKHQRPHHQEPESELPPPPKNGDSPKRIRESRSDFGRHLLGRDTGNRKGECSSKATDEDGFPTFWQAYPRREARAAALKAWKKLSPDAALQATILGAIKASASKWTDPKYIPFPATFINGKRWEDEAPISARVPDPLQARTAAWAKDMAAA